MKNRVLNNISWIVACRIVQALLTFVVNIFTVRYLGPSNYGLVSYAASVVTFVAPIMKLGLDGILVREFVDRPQQEGAVIGTTFGLTLLSGIGCIIGIGTFASVANHGEPQTIIVCLLYSTILLAQAIELLQFWFQAKLMSKQASLAMLAAYAVMSAYQIYLLISGKSVYWFALSKTLDVVVIDVCLVIMYKRKSDSKITFSKELAGQMLKKGKYYIVSSMMVTVFAQTDRIMLKMLIDDAATGYYSAAVACAGMTSFVFTAIIDSFRPVILQAKQTHTETFERKMVLLYSIVIYFALAQSVVITVAAPWIVRILYGAEYQPSAGILKLIVWYTTFSYMGAVRDIWILAYGKEKILWKINLSGALVNVTLNCLLIPFWGAIGAAAASLITQIFTNVVLNFLVKDIRRTGHLIWMSFNPKWCMQSLRSVKEQIIKKR